MSRWIALLVLCLALAPCTAAAQIAEPVGGTEYGILDFANRLTLGARLEHRWADSPILARDWGVGVAGSYALVPKWALTCKVLYRLGNDDLDVGMEYDAGINYVFYGAK